MTLIKERKLLLIAPKFFGYEKEIESEIRNAGYSVDYFDTRPANDFKTKLAMRLGLNIFIRKNLLKHRNELLTRCRLNSYDRVVFINPEGFDKKYLAELRAIIPNAKLTLYLWDSLSNKPLAKSILNNFDDVFSFDPIDAKTYRSVNYLPLFFSDKFKQSQDFGKEYLYDVCFIGTVHGQRLKIIKEVKSQCKNNGLSFYNFLYLQSIAVYWVRKLTQSEFRHTKVSDFQYDPLPKEKVAEIVDKSRAVLDIEHHHQKGMTMRTFEVLASGVKLITTNKAIKDTNLYDKNNVLIVDRENPVIDKYFIKMPFNQYDEAVLKEYAISSWVKKMLGE